MPDAALLRFPFPAALAEYEAEIDAEIAADDYPPILAHAREAWAKADGAVTWLHRALDANATQDMWWCDNAARGFRAAAALSPEPQRTQLEVLADAAELIADPLGPDDDAVRALIDAAGETVAALAEAMRRRHRHTYPHR